MGRDQYRAFVLTALRVEDSALVEMTAFARPELFATFGLPLVLDQKGAPAEVAVPTRLARI